MRWFSFICFQDKRVSVLVMQEAGSPNQISLQVRISIAQSRIYLSEVVAVHLGMVLVHRVLGGLDKEKALGTAPARDIGKPGVSSDLCYSVVGGVLVLC